jgi:hypothetical protein
MGIGKNTLPEIFFAASVIFVAADVEGISRLRVYFFQMQAVNAADAPVTEALLSWNSK